MRILHAPLNTAGQPAVISRAQRQLGFQSDVLVYRQNYLNYSCDINLRLNKKQPFLSMVRLFVNFVRCLANYDVFHFHSGLSLLPFNWDLPILKLFGKKVVMQYWGSDVLQIDIAKNYALFSDDQFKKIFGKINNVKKRKWLRWIEKTVDCTIVGDEALLVFSPESRLVRKVLDFSDIPFVGTPNKQKKLVIIHAPSKREIKGTKYVLKAINRLKREKYSFEFILVEKKTHAVAKEFYKKADIIVDDVLQGPYGILAMECMAFGKPVICRIDEKLVKYYKNLPVVSANPETLYEELKKLILNPSLRNKLGIEGRKYIEKNHDALKIAKEFINLYRSLDGRKETDDLSLPKISGQKPYFRLKPFSIKRVSEKDLPYYTNCYLDVGQKYPADENGVIQYLQRSKPYYCPTQVAQLAYNELFRYRKKGNKKNLQTAVSCAEVLLKQSVRHGKAVYIKHEYNFYLHSKWNAKMAAPWFSGMSQGQTLSLLCRLYHITKDKKYLETAKGVFSSFSDYRQENKPWICDIDYAGFLWIEEFPVKSGDHHALNGFIFAIFGLYDYYWLTQDKKAKTMICAALTTLWHYLPNYRCKNGLSYYCLKHKTQSKDYHKIHIDQLNTLYKITGEKYFKKTADDFYEDFH